MQAFTRIIRGSIHPSRILSANWFIFRIVDCKVSKEKIKASENLVSL